MGIWIQAEDFSEDLLSTWGFDDKGGDATRRNIHCLYTSIYASLSLGQMPIKITSTYGRCSWEYIVHKNKPIKHPYVWENYVIKVFCLQLVTTPHKQSNGLSNPLVQQNVANFLRTWLCSLTISSSGINTLIFNINIII